MNSLEWQNLAHPSNYRFTIAEKIEDGKKGHAQVKEKNRSVFEQRAQSRGNIAGGRVGIPRQNRAEAGYIIIDEFPFQLEPKPVHPIEVAAFNLLLQILNSLHTLAYECAHHQ